MEHLSHEDLARLVDEAPSPDERRHLASCRECVSELDALREQTEALGSLPDLRPPTGDWDELEERLVEEGLVTPKRPSTRFARMSGPGWLQAAAALVLFLGGTGTGVLLARTSPDDPAGGGETVVQAETPDEAAEALRTAEERYLDALVQYRRVADGGEPASDAGDPASRYAALEALVAAGRAAVRQAPADPFINGVLVSTLAERQETLRQISTSTAGNWF